MPVTGRSTLSYRHPPHTKRERRFEALFGGRGWQWATFHASAAECTSLFKPGISTAHAQAATLSSTKSAVLPPIEHTNAFWHQEVLFLRCSELNFWRHTGLDLAHGKLPTLYGRTHVLMHRPDRASCSLTLIMHGPQTFAGNVDMAQ
jgi:hypothetical protein